MDFLFGADMPLAVRFFFAFVIVLALIGGTAFLVRRFGGERLGASSSRGRQPRLAVIDAAAVDGRRRLILIRRDNVEHLLMIGGPSDVVVEANIVRAAAPARDGAGQRPEALPRAVPMNDGNMWPLQPEPAPAPAPAPRQPRAPAAEESMQWQEPEPMVPMVPPPRRPEPRPEPRAKCGPSPVPRCARSPVPKCARSRALRCVRSPAPRCAPSHALRCAPSRGRKCVPRPVRSHAPSIRSPVSPPSFHGCSRSRRRPRCGHRANAKSRAPAPRSPNACGRPRRHLRRRIRPAADADQNLAEMAQRLEAALRRPKPAEPSRADAPSRQPMMPSAAPEPMMPEPVADSAAPRDDAPPAAPQPRAAAAPKPQKSVYDSLEQEMASLLGRPNSKA